MSSNLLPDTEHRVANATDEDINRRIRLKTDLRVRETAAQGRQAIDRRLEELDSEWDIERTLEANAATAVVLSMLLGATVNRRYFAMPVVVGGFLLQHALQGWCPPVPVFRRIGIRTTKEINEERYALKALRGDFGNETENGNASTALAAARR